MSFIYLLYLKLQSLHSCFLHNLIILGTAPEIEHTVLLKEATILQKEQLPALRGNVVGIVV